MDMYKEIDKETMELLLGTLAERTLAGKQEWEKLEYKPVSFGRENEEVEADAFICHMFEMETDFNGRHYTLEVMEQIDLPSCKGDISGTLEFNGDRWGKYDFALSFDGRYDECSAECLKEVFEDSPIVKLMEAIVSVFEGTEAEEWGFSYARYFNQIGIEPEWEQMPLVKLGEKLMDGKRMRDFHRIVLDMDYRRELLGEV